jgi:hypothetical protein
MLFKTTKKDFPGCRKSKIKQSKQAETISTLVSAITAYLCCCGSAEYKIETTSNCSSIIRTFKMSDLNAHGRGKLILSKTKIALDTDCIDDAWVLDHHAESLICLI